LVKQPAKRPRAARKPADSLPSDDSVAVTSQAVDPIPPEVHAKSDGPQQPPEIDTQPAVPQPPPPPQEPAPPHDPAPVQPPRSRGGFVPLVLGGLVAGAIGFAVASLTTPTQDTDITDLLAAQDASIAALRQQIAGQETVDLTPITTEQTDLATQIARLQDELATISADLAAMTALADRVAALESRPVTDTTGAVSSPAVDAFEAEIAALRAELTDLTDMARTELETARAEAAAIEQNAAAAARNAAGRAALARLQTGIESGAPLGAAIGDLEQVLGTPAPDALLAVQDGVPTLATLQDSFPTYARAALTSARAEGVAGENSSGVGGFLRNQFQVRSVNPRDGDDADAILSRAQAALRNGRLTETLTKIGTLPEVARAEMSEWIALAETRTDAVAAIDTLATTLRDN
jgi:hypothetical protein